MSQQQQQLQQQQDKGKVVSWQDSDGDLWLKGFLINGKISQNEWGVNPSTIPDILKKTAIGQPITLYKDRGDEQDRHKHKRVAGSYNHPVLALPEFGDTIHDAYARQEAASIGRIFEVQYDEKTGDWYWIGKITDQPARQGFAASSNMPKYTSPSIWINKFQPRKIVYASDGITPVDIEDNPQAQVEDWRFMHIALVDTPAYGTQAMITAKCTGDAETCMNHLKYASESAVTEKAGKDHGACGCTKQGIIELAQKTAVNESLSDTSRKSTNTQDNSVIMSVNENSENRNEKTTEKKTVVEEKKQETAAQPQPNQNSPAEKKAQVDDPNQQLAASLIKDLTNENKQLKAFLETQQPLIASLQQKVATMEDTLKKQDKERQVWGLRNVVQTSPLYKHLPIEKQDELVQKYASADMTEDSLREFIAPFETANPTHYVKEAPVAPAVAPTQKVASVSNQNQVPSTLDYPAQKVASSEGSPVTNRQPKFKLISQQLREVGI